MSLTAEILKSKSDYGFLLTRQAYDTKKGIELSLWLYQLFVYLLALVLAYGLKPSQHSNKIFLYSVAGLMVCLTLVSKGSNFIFTTTFEKSKEKINKRKIIPEYIKDLKILVVEDNEHAREVLSNYLVEYGYDPILVASGEEAISEIKKANFDLILMDYKMPGLNGVETWKQIKNIMPISEQPKCVLVTA